MASNKHEIRSGGKFISKKEKERRENQPNSINRQRTEPITCESRPSGRRIVDIGVLSDQLWCKQCDRPLSLRHIVSERKLGLCSRFTIKCQLCSNLHNVESSKAQLPKQSRGGPNLYDVNFKAAIGMIDSGIGTQQVNRFLTAMNIPGVSETLMKSYERKVGPSIEEVAKDTCLQMANLEKQAHVTHHSLQEGASLDKSTLVVQAPNHSSRPDLDLATTCLLEPLSLDLTFLPAMVHCSTPIRHRPTKILRPSPAEQLKMTHHITPSHKRKAASQMQGTNLKMSILEKRAHLEQSPTSSRSLQNEPHSTTMDTITDTPCRRPTTVDWPTDSSTLDSRPTHDPSVASSTGPPENEDFMLPTSPNFTFSSVIDNCPTPTGSKPRPTMRCSPASTSHLELSPRKTPRKQKLPVAVKIDVGWQMRGNGKAYKSNSGHGAIMGYHTSKVLDFATRCKKCRKCERGVAKNKHDCRLNWYGSAKGMEPDLAVQLVTKSTILSKSGLAVNVLVGDDDSSTMAALRKENTEFTIEKWSDLNHCKKGISNGLYKLKAKGFKCLTGPVINYLKRCFGFAVFQNKGDPINLEKALLNIPCHVFGEHIGCGDWCRFKTNSEAKHTYLPGGKPLSGDDLKKSLSELFTRFANNAAKIAPCASTQSNEALNSAIAAKNPKAKFYSASESNDYRVSAAVGQVNIGSTYVTSVNVKLGLSPGEHSSLYRKWLDKRRKINKARQSSVHTKKRRLFLKAQRDKNDTRRENREGTSYKSDMGMLLPEPVLAEPLHEEMYIDGNEFDKFKICYYDIETTGLSTSSSVMQIAGNVDNEFYSVYILPQSIPTKVTEVTGLAIRKGRLLLNGSEVTTESRKDAWVGFVNFLKNIGTPVILVGHNVAFDLRYTLKEISECNLLTEFIKVVYGTTDTVKVIKKALPGLENYKQTTIAEKLTVFDEAGAHNALGDIRILKNISVKLGISHNQLQSNCVSLYQQMDKKRKVFERKAKMESLHELKGCITTTMIRKIATAGINMQDLKNAMALGGEESLKMLMCENCNNRPRVTKNKKVITALCMFLGKE